MEKCYHYSIKLKNKRIVSREKERCDKKMIEVETFEKPVTKNNLPKLYVVKDANSILYVGITCQSIASRLRGGFQAKGERGYYGYGWKDIITPLDLFIFCFEGEEHKEEYKKAETIEAELVYLIRKKTGNWPKNQTEIHFHNTKKEEYQSIIDSIYKKIK
jgi:hypothetical protein